MAQAGVTIMTIPKKPKLDAWYEDGEGRSFKIVAIDDHDNTIEIQYFDGDVAEVESDTWYLLDLQSIEEPENGSGPFDSLEEDDIDGTSRPARPEDLSEPLDEMDTED